MELGAAGVHRPGAALRGLPRRRPVPLAARRRAGARRADPAAGRPGEGTDRQVRGLLLAALRAADGPMTSAALARPHRTSCCSDPRQRSRALDGLVADGLVEPVDAGLFRLPTHFPHLAMITEALGSWFRGALQ